MVPSANDTRLCWVIGGLSPVLGGIVCSRLSPSSANSGSGIISIFISTKINKYSWKKIVICTTRDSLGSYLIKLYPSVSCIQVGQNIDLYIRL